jgi:hypothetical protein
MPPASREQIEELDQLVCNTLLNLVKNPPKKVLRASTIDCVIKYLRLKGVRASNLAQSQEALQKLSAELAVPFP